VRYWFPYSWESWSPLGHKLWHDMGMSPNIERGSNQEIRVALVLSGGGARGIAHIGAIKALERAQIPIDFLAGSSMGGIIAAAYACGLSPDEMVQEAGELSRVRQFLRLADPGLPDAGLLRGQRLQAYFEERLGNRTFEQLERPLALMAVDLNTRKEVILQEGSVSVALRATMALPGLFMPLEIDGMRLVDGGLLNNLPVDVAKKTGAKIVIAVDVSPDPEDIPRSWETESRWLPGGLARTFVILDEATRLMMKVIQEAKLEKYPPDVIIRPNLPSGVNVLAGYGRITDVVEAGENAVEDLLSDIQAQLHSISSA
jgi:NTE family protein